MQRCSVFLNSDIYAMNIFKRLGRLCLFFMCCYLLIESPAYLDDFEKTIARTNKFLVLEISGFITFLLYACLTYFLLLKLHNRVHALVLAGAFVLIAIPIMIGSRYIMQEVIVYSITGKHNYIDTMRTLKAYTLDNIGYALYYGLLGAVYYFIEHAQITLKQKAELKLLHQKAELDYLRSQINPHFLFNSLNNIYALVYANSANSLSAISQLAELLRYLIYTHETTVALDKEFAVLHHFIELQKLRFGFEPNLVVNLPPTVKEKIAPMLLLPFVENAFKHGELNDTAHPMKITATLNQQELYFMVENKIAVGEKNSDSGIGLDNVERRLELQYPDRHVLTVTVNDDVHTVKLKIQLHE